MCRCINDNIDTLCKQGNIIVRNVAFVYIYVLVVIIVLLQVVVAVLLDNFFRVSSQQQAEVHLCMRARILHECMKACPL